MFQTKAKIAVSCHLLGLVVLLGAGALGSGTALAQDKDLPVLSLQECVELALQRSPGLLITEERRLIAGKDVTAAKGAFLPDVSLSHSWGKSEHTDYDVSQYNRYYTEEPFYTYDSANDSTLWFQQVAQQEFLGVDDETFRSTSKSYSASASMNLFSGFSKFANLNAARNSLKAAEANRDYQKELVVEEVTSAYFNLLRYIRLLDVARESQDQAAKELERTETYFRLGSAAKSDVLQQRVRLENTRLDVVVADNNVKKAFVDLAYSMNRPLAAAFTVDTAALSTDFTLEEVDALYAEALQRRLDLKSSEFNLAASRNNVTSASSNLLPRVDLNAPGQPLRERLALPVRGSEKRQRELGLQRVLEHLRPHADPHRAQQGQGQRAHRRVPA